MSSSSSKSASIFSSSCVVTVLLVIWMSLAIFNLYKLMFPLAMVDVSSVSKSNLVGPLWDQASPMNLKVYLSSRRHYSLEFVKADGGYTTGDDDATNTIDDVVLLWQQDISTHASLSKSFLLTTLGECETEEKETCPNPEQDASFVYASQWLDHAEQRSKGQDGGILSQLSASAGEGMESTSVLISLYNTISSQVRHVSAALGFTDDKDSSDEEKTKNDENLLRTTVSLSPESPLWSQLQTNSTLHVHVVVTRGAASADTTPTTVKEAMMELRRAHQQHSLLLGHVSLIKYDVPRHITPPKRVLYRDLVYLVQRYVLHAVNGTPPPWDTASTKPNEHEVYQGALDMKARGAGYPYWKPEVAVKYVNDNVLYPTDYVGASGMEVVQLPHKSSVHPTGFAQMPALHVDELGLTSEKYIPVNETLKALPLRITVDRSDLEHHTKATTATAGGMSPARWRLLSHLSTSLESQKELGFEESDIDDLRRLIADTNVMLLAITVLASGLHLLFEFLTFKNEVSFWRSNKDLTGLSVRSLFLDTIGQVIILMFLIEKDSSLLMTVPAGIGCLIALWKCQRGAGFKLLRVDSSNNDEKASWWNVVPRIFGHELRATRLDIKRSSDTKDNAKPSSQDLAALTIETDRIATQTLGSILLPLVIAYTAYSFVNEEHTGWYSWLITSASSAVYALGFVLMTPQLFLNYKLKSVAHLPWRVLVYKFLNTFIDDLFAFIIRMPTMARLSCFRDDIVFVIYLYQRWLYPVDRNRREARG